MADSVAVFRQVLGGLAKQRGKIAEICRDSGFNRSTIDYWINGETVPRLDQVDKVAAVLNREPWQLIAPGAADAIPMDRYMRESEDWINETERLKAENEALRRSIQGMISDKERLILESFRDLPENKLKLLTDVAALDEPHFETVARTARAVFNTLADPLRTSAKPSLKKPKTGL